LATYSFVNWTDETGNVVGTTPAINLLIAADKTLTANYREVVVTHVLTISAGTGGTTSPAPGSWIYDEGTTALVTAYPTSGYRFDHWVLDGVTHTEVAISVLMDADHTLNAVFTPISPTERILTISTTTGGTTDPAPGAYVYADGDVAQAIAYPSMGYLFDHWMIDETIWETDNPVSILMDGNHTLTAVFVTAPPVSPYKKIAIVAGVIGVAGTAVYLGSRRKK
jgi:hypothetical protein